MLTETENSLSLINGKASRASFLGKLIYYLLPVRRKTVLSNMTLAFGNALDKRQIRTLAQNFYEHLLRLCVENLAMGFMTKNQMRSRVRVIGHENVLAAAQQNKGILLLSGHFGNWEFAPVCGMLHFQEFKGRFHILRRTLVNKLVERILFRRFYEAGLDVIPKKNSLNQVLNNLAKNDVVTFIMDQHAKPGKDGVVVDFLGKKAGTFKSLAVVARTTGSPVIPTFCYREKDGSHVMRFLEPLKWIEDPDPDQELLENTRAYNRVLGDIVLRYPDQWWWVHRRWKLL